MMWSLRMAWRDSRGSRRRLVLYLSSMVLGVAALVAIDSFGDNLRRAIDEQAKTLLGADLSLESRQPFVPPTEALIDSLGGDQSRRISFASMAYFPESGATRLATVRAIEGDYPYYGRVETRPARAAQTYLGGRNALVDGTLLTQYGVAVGDSVRIGNVTYRVAGELVQTPRESSAMMLFSPRIYIPLAFLDRSLLATGSRAEYEVYFKFEEGRDLEALIESIQPHLKERRIGHDTVDEVKENWDEGLTNLYRFLSLVAFVAVLLGGLGVASAVHVYIKQRIATVAVLRCLGASTRRMFSIYLVQAAAMGALGAVAGCLLGLGVQAIVPVVLADFLPVEVAFAPSWRAILIGLGVGIGVTLLFALLPLLAVRNASPLLALRSNTEEEGRRSRDGLRWLVYALIGAGIAAFAILLAPDWQIGLGYAAGVAVVFGLLTIVAKGIMVMTQRFFPSSWAYVWRQGLANLYRPNNQTVVLMLVLGLGTFLIMTLFVIQQTLLAQIEVSGGEGRPNVVLFDIQPQQIEAVTNTVRARGLPVMDRVPIVTMRLASVKGRTVDDLRADSTFDTNWAHRREYRSSYRDHLTDSETVIAGTFTPTMPEGTDVAPISIEQDIAAELEVELGDTLGFNVQGRIITTVVGSIREVDWRRISTNFFVVFPTGVLEEAPQMHVLLTRTEDAQASAALQSEVVGAFPNVSAIDLSLVLNVFDAIFGRISFVIRFMALFSILTGLIVLMGAVVVSRYQRVEESVLLKTLGASRAQVFKIMLIEYLFLGLFATLTGVVLSVAAGWVLSLTVFEGPYVPSPLPMGIALVIVTGLTILIGLLNSRGIYNRTPLEVLRAEI